MTICNVCTLNLRQANYNLKNDAAMLARVNENLVRWARRRTAAASRSSTCSG